MWSAVAWATIGVMSMRSNFRVTCSCVFPPAGLTALHEPRAAAAFSPPGAFGGGDVSMVVGGLGSVTKSQAAFGGGAAVVMGPLGQGCVTDVPSMWLVTTVSTSALVGSWVEALTATRAPSRAAWFRVS